MAGQRWGLPELQILGLFGGGRKLHGGAVVAETQLPVSTVYDVLQRFETAGYLTREREKVLPHISNRVPKVLYCGTTVAVDQLVHIRELVGAA